MVCYSSVKRRGQTNGLKKYYCDCIFIVLKYSVNCFFNVRFLSGRPAMTKDSLYLKRNTDMTRAVT